jgi:hypothetical protein
MQSFDGIDLISWNIRSAKEAVSTAGAQRLPSMANLTGRRHFRAFYSYHLS